MGTTGANHSLTVDEFLEWESLQEERYELVDGLVRAYQQLDSLQQYVLVSQDQPRVEVYRRNPTSKHGWSYDVVLGLAATVLLEPATTPLTLAAIYEGSSVADSSN
jgi:hypothetical protein